MTKAKLTQEKIKELLDYNPETGVFTWKERFVGDEKSTKSWNSRFSGKEAGRVRNDGYMQVSLLINGKPTKQFLHRLAIIYMDGCISGDVDHKNGVKNDNRYSNLRCVTHQENRINICKSKDNKSGVTGVVMRKNGRWQAQITSNMQSFYLGTFNSFFDAVCARKSAEVKFGFFEAQKYRGLCNE